MEQLIIVTIKMQQRKKVREFHMKMKYQVEPLPIFNDATLHTKKI